MLDDLELVMMRLRNLMEFYKRSPENASSSLEKDILELQNVMMSTVDKPLTKLERKIKVLKSWEGAI